MTLPRWNALWLLTVVALGCAAPLAPRDWDSPAADETANAATPANAPARIAGEPAEEEPDAVAERAARDIDDGLGSVDEVLAEGRRRGAIDERTEREIRSELTDVPATWRAHIAAARIAVLERKQPKPTPSPGVAAAVSPPGDAPTAVATIKTSQERQPVAAKGVAPEPANPLRKITAEGVAFPPVVDVPRTTSPLATAPGTSQPADVAMASATLATSVREPDDASTAARHVATSFRGPPPPADDRDAGAEWRVVLGAAIRSLEESLRTAAKPATAATLADERALRLLYLAADRRDDALRPIDGLPAAEQQFWNEWLFGTSLLLSAEGSAGEARRAASAAEHLRAAVATLGEQSHLQVRNLAFCRRVTSFGAYDKLTTAKTRGDSSPDYVFTRDQEVIVYAEVVNFASQPTEKGYRTELRASYQILDAAGRRVGPIYDLGVSHDYCHERRTDFFVRFHRHLPAGIEPGTYKLTLTIEDLTSNKVGESSVEFAIRPGK
jgi:hypothetical protein